MIRILLTIAAIVASISTARATMSADDTMTCKMPKTGTVKVEWMNFSTEVRVTMAGKAHAYLPRGNSLTPVNNVGLPTFVSKGMQLERVDAGKIVEKGRCK